MKLLLVSRSIPLHTGTGGMEVVLWDLAKALGKELDVEVLTTSVPSRPDSFIEEGVRVSTISGTKPGRYSLARAPMIRGMAYNNQRSSRSRFGVQWRYVVLAVLALLTVVICFLALTR
jgi:hypothetical protein